MASGSKIPSRCRAGHPPPAYQNVSGDGVYPWTGDSFYASIGNDIDSRKLINSFVIPIRSGRAWEVKQGQICRIVSVEGPQVGDFNVWNLHDPRERMWAARTRQLERAHLTVFDKIWSTLPFLRPMLTITGDSLKNYGKDAEGGRVHDLLGTRCDPYVNRMLTGKDFDYNCHSNLVRAVLPHGLTEFDVHDVLNIFQCTGLNSEDKYFMKSCPAKKGDFFEFFAEMDLLCALSTCPSGDQSIPLWGPDSSDDKLIKICRPLGVEVYEVDPSRLVGWTPPQKAAYKNCHGLTAQAWAQQ